MCKKTIAWEKWDESIIEEEMMEEVFEEELEEISAMGGGANGGFAGNAYGPAGMQCRKPKKETKKVEETTNKLLNYLLQIAGEK